MKKTVFLDRDGTINIEKNYLYQPADFQFIEGAERAIKRLNENGYQVIVVSNQAGVARGYYTEEDVEVLHTFVNAALKKHGAHIDGFYYCPHHPVAGIGFYKRICNCRKPNVGLFEKACQDFSVDVQHSFMIGDNRGDMEAGRNFGLHTILVSTGYGQEIFDAGQVAYDYYTKNLETAVDYILGTCEDTVKERCKVQQREDGVRVAADTRQKYADTEKEVMQSQENVMEHLEELIHRYPVLASCKQDIEQAYIYLKELYLQGGKLLVAGNGGSAADAEHIVGELMKSFVKKRAVSDEFCGKLLEIHKDYGEELGQKLQGALPAIALTAQEGIATAYLNDVDGQLLYAQLLNGYGVSGDVFLGISTSGNSKNILMAAVTAKAKGMKVIGLTGATGGALKSLADVTICVPETETFKIQELHLPVYHALCLMLEEHFF